MDPGKYLYSLTDMKVKIRFNKRSNVMITLIACGAALAMMVVRFDYPAEKLFEALWVAVVLLGGLVGAAALLGLGLRCILILFEKRSAVTAEREQREE